MWIVVLIFKSVVSGYAYLELHKESRPSCQTQIDLRQHALSSHFTLAGMYLCNCVASYMGFIRRIRFRGC
ncbi:hypothetical protein L1887_21213 [Cichorium endivia]|nr:hypothetical protein L1887_21213 [Cichorium endivia]